MAVVLTDDAHYQAIAEAIRSKNGEATKYKPAEMAAAIAQIETGGVKIHLYDIGSADFDPMALDFSQYSAGDVVLVVADMGGGEA